MRRSLRIIALSTAASWAAASAHGAGKPAPDACGLITPAELQSIQGGTFRQAKPSRRGDGTFLVLQCVYDLDPFSKSVSVTVTRAGAPHGDRTAVRAQWDRIFHSRTPGARESDEESEREGEHRPVPGVGQQAFWEPSRVGGALYVFQKDAFLRVSVGGAESDSARLERTVRLARKALRRL